MRFRNKAIFKWKCIQIEAKMCHIFIYKWVSLSKPSITAFVSALILIEHNVPLEAKTRKNKNMKTPNGGDLLFVLVLVL